VWLAALALGGGAAPVIGGQVLGQTPGGGQSSAPSSGAALTGRVRGPDGKPLPGATVSLVASGDSVAAGDSGRYVLSGLRARPYVVVIRKVGFQPERRLVTLPPGGTADLSVSLSPGAHTLSTVVTVAKTKSAYHLVGLDTRIRSGLGQFITYDQILKRRPTGLSQLLASMHGFQTSGDNYADPTTRQSGSRQTGSCVGFLIDGVRQAKISVHDMDDVIPIEEVGAVEYYRPSEVPAEWADAAQSVDSLPQVRQRFHGQGQNADSTVQYQAPNQSPTCAVAVIWTRTRLGLSETEVRSERSVAGGAARGAFAGGLGLGGDLGPTRDTAAFVVYGVLEGGEADSRDERWVNFADSVLRAIKGSFALPSDVGLPAFGFPFRALVSPDTTGHVSAATAAAPTVPSLEVSPAASGVIVFSLDSIGGVSDVRVAATSLSGTADTAMLAAIEGAAAAHAFPHMPAPRGGAPLRFDLAFSTLVPASDDRSIPLAQIEAPVWSLQRPVAIDSGAMPDLSPPASAHAPRRDSTTFEFVVDDQGHALGQTARVIGGPAGGTDPTAYRVFLTRIVRALPQFTFRPAMVGTCSVQGLLLQPFVYRR